MVRGAATWIGVLELGLYNTCLNITGDGGYETGRLEDETGVSTALFNGMNAGKGFWFDIENLVGRKG